MSIPESLLVIAPHADDEVLVAGGLTRRVADAGGMVTVAVMNLEEAKRSGELGEACRVLGSVGLFWSCEPSGIDQFPLREAVTWIEQRLVEFRPECMVVCSGQHQDHVVSRQAGMRAVRASGATDRYRPPLVLLGESPGEEVDPQLTVSLSREQMIAKLEAMECHESQVRPQPSERSEDAIMALAKLRGVSAGVTWGESYQVLRDLR